MCQSFTRWQKVIARGWNIKSDPLSLQWFLVDHNTTKLLAWTLSSFALSKPKTRRYDGCFHAWRFCQNFVVVTRLSIYPWYPRSTESQWRSALCSTSSVVLRSCVHRCLETLDRRRPQTPKQMSSDLYSQGSLCAIQRLWEEHQMR